MLIRSLSTTPVYLPIKNDFYRSKTVKQTAQLRCLTNRIVNYDGKTAIQHVKKLDNYISTLFRPALVPIRHPICCTALWTYSVTQTTTESDIWCTMLGDIEN